MSQVISLRLRDEQMERLGRVARRLGRSPSETSSLLLEEALRMAEFAFIQFRDSAVGRQAYIQGTSLAVWEVVFFVRSYEDGAEHAAEHAAADLRWPLAKIQAALNYAAAYPNEIEAAIADNRPGFEVLSRMLPGIQIFEVSDEDEADDTGTSE